MAHAIFVAEARKRSLAVEIYSAGVFDFSDQPPLVETSITCLQHNTPPPKETPTWVRDLPLNSINRFLVMEQDHADVLTAEFGISPERISLLGTFDPRRRGAEFAVGILREFLEHAGTGEQISDCIIGYLDTTDELS